MPLAINQMIVIISVIAIVLAARSGCGAEISLTFEHDSLKPEQSELGIYENQTY